MRGLPRLVAHPVLVAAYPVLFLYATNIDETSLAEVVPVLGVVVVATLALQLVATLLLRDTGRVALVLTGGLVVFLGYRHLALLAVGTPLAGRPIQGLLVVMLVAAIVVALRGGRLLERTNRTLDVVAFALVVVSVASIVPAELGRPAATPVDPLPGPSGAPGTADDPDIWYLIFDRYGSADSLELAYDITDNDLPDWLRSQGFQVAERARANYHRTSLSIASSLNLDYLASLTPSSTGLLDDHAAGRLLLGRGYRYIHIGSAYGATRSSSIATVNPALDTATDFAVAFYDSTLVPIVSRLLSTDGIGPARRRFVDWARFTFGELDAARAEPGPKLVFGHLLLPHPPYVFDRDGRPITDDEAEGRPVAEAFADQLVYTNARIRELVTALLAVPEAERPVIIIAGDEGPYPARYATNDQGGQAARDFDWATATEEEIRIKFGILLAIHVPGDAPPPLPDAMSSVNTLRFVFREVLGVDLPALPDRSYGPSTNGLVELTDRLPGS